MFFYIPCKLIQLLVFFFVFCVGAQQAYLSWSPLTKILSSLCRAMWNMPSPDESNCSLIVLAWSRWVNSAVLSVLCLTKQLLACPYLGLMLTKPIVWFIKLHVNTLSVVEIVRKPKQTHTVQNGGNLFSTYDLVSCYFIIIAIIFIISLLAYVLFVVFFLKVKGIQPVHHETSVVNLCVFK